MFACVRVFKQKKMARNDSFNVCEGLEKFDGSQNINDYLRYFEAKILIGKYNEVQSFKILASKLEGIAFERFILLQKKLTTYDQLKQFLLETYTIKKKKINLLASLFAQKQEESEHIESFYLRITFTLNDAKIEDFNSNSETGRAYLFGYIAQNMKKSLRDRIPVNFDPQDIDELMSELRSLDHYDSSFTQVPTSTPSQTSEFEQSNNEYFTPKPHFKTPAQVQFLDRTPINRYRTQGRNNYRQARFAPFDRRSSYRNEDYSRDQKFNSPKNYSRLLALPPQ